MKVEGIIFDFDGTLLDSMPLWDTIGETYLRMKDVEPEANIKEQLKSLSLTQAAMYVQEKYGIMDTIEQIIADINGLIKEAYFYKLPLKPAVLEALEAFKRKGVKMCIATAGNHSLVKAVLKRFQIESYFEGILTCEQVNAGKDEPVIFEKAVELLACKKEAVAVFEDSLHAIQTAKKAGFYVVAVEEASSKEELEKIKDGADYYVKTILDWKEGFQ